MHIRSSTQLAYVLYKNNNYLMSLVFEVLKHSSALLSHRKFSWLLSIDLHIFCIHKY